MAWYGKFDGGAWDAAQDVEVETRKRKDEDEEQDWDDKTMTSTYISEDE